MIFFSWLLQEKDKNSAFFKKIFQREFISYFVCFALLTSNDYRFNSVLIHRIVYHQYCVLRKCSQMIFLWNHDPLRDSNTRDFALIFAIWKIRIDNEEPHSKHTQTSCVTFWVTGCNATSHLFASSSPLRLCTFVAYLHESIGKIYSLTNW